MERRKAVIAAATASLTLLAGAAAIGLNTSIVGASKDDGAGQISPVATDTGPPTTITLDDPATDPASADATGQAPAVTRDDSDDRYEGEDDRDDGTGHEDGYEAEYEYEGADDDD